MKRVKGLAVLGLSLLAVSVLSAQENDWINMFDGKTLNGWKANENPESTRTPSPGVRKMERL